MNIQIETGYLKHEIIRVMVFGIKMLLTLCITC